MNAKICLYNYSKETLNILDGNVLNFPKQELPSVAPVAPPANPASTLQALSIAQNLVAGGLLGNASQLGALGGLGNLAGGLGGLVNLGKLNISDFLFRKFIN